MIGMSKSKTQNFKQFSLPALIEITIDCLYDFKVKHNIAYVQNKLAKTITSKHTQSYVYTEWLCGSLIWSVHRVLWQINNDDATNIVD